jgi:uncharacterized membrane protein YkvA (DUF1232 family)
VDAVQFGKAASKKQLIPVIGPLDDVIVVALALRYAACQMPRQVIRERGSVAAPSVPEQFASWFLVDRRSDHRRSGC